MRAILQRVESASVTVDGEIIGAIGRGWLALVGVASGSSPEDAEKLAEKTAQLRAFSDAEGKMNLSVEDVRGAILAVSNFTLYADCRKGRRPSFVGAASPEKARPLFDTYVNGLRARGIKTETGRFGADMKVSLVNDGPVTLILEVDLR